MSNERSSSSLITHHSSLITHDPSLFPRFLQRDRPIEYDSVVARVGVDAEVAEALELVAGHRGGVADARLELGVLDHFERMRIEVVEEVAALLRQLALEETIVESHFTIDGVMRRHPMQRRFRPAAVGRVAAAR